MRLMLFIFLIILRLNAFSQPTSSINSNYLKAYETLNDMLTNKQAASFKEAVFVTENAYFKDSLDYLRFQEQIFKLGLLVDYWMKANPLQKYHYPDSADVHKNYALFKLLKDTLRLTVKGKERLHLPYTYDFTDFDGQHDWRDMFLTKLLAYQSGNCHSLPYLYKILADEIGASCWLSLAPNHMYIKNRCERDGWYNTELTTGTFPIDAWIMGSGYIPLQAVQSGIYMDTLSNQQSIALCILDLAKEYEHQVKSYDDGFILKCCDLSLQYFPLNVQALLLKAETLKRVYEKEAKTKSPAAKTTFNDMQALYVRLLDLGYREMPDKMYQQWLFSVQKEKAKYNNKRALH